MTLKLPAPQPGQQGAGRLVTISVGFGLHTFTRERLPDDAPGTAYVDSRESRTFCEIRYGESLRLPSIVQDLPGKHCMFAKHENFVQIQAGLKCYAVFFNVMRRRRDGPDEAMLFVQSAYLLDPGKSRPDHGRIRFDRLVELILAGTQPRPPQRR